MTPSHSPPKGTVSPQQLIDLVVAAAASAISTIVAGAVHEVSLEHIDTRFFAQTFSQIEAQGVSQRVAAELACMHRRAYQRKCARAVDASPSPTRIAYVVEAIAAQDGVATRADIEAALSNVDQAVVGAILQQLVVKGILSHTAQGYAPTPRPR